MKDEIPVLLSLLLMSKLINNKNFKYLFAILNK